MVSPYISVTQGRNAFPFQADFCIRLRAGLHIINDFAVYRINHNFTAKRRYRKGHRNRRVNIHILSLENRMPSDDYFYEQVASRSAVCSRFSLISDSDALAIINPRRNRYLDFLLICDISRAVTILALLFNNLSGSVTVRTSLNASGRSEENLLCKHDLTFSAAFGAGFRAGSRFCAAAAACRTFVL